MSEKATVYDLHLYLKGQTALCSREPGECVLGREEVVGEAGRSVGTEICGWDELYERRIYVKQKVFHNRLFLLLFTFFKATDY